MPCRTLRYTSKDDWSELQQMLQGREDPENTIETRVLEIFKEIKTRGDAALAEYTGKFDCPGFTVDNLRVAPEELEQARQTVPASDLAILEEAAANIRDYHQAQVQQSTLSTQPDGTVLGRLVRPLDRVGLYVPGGQGGETPLISSLLMNAIPAQVVGVAEIVLVSPPRKDGTLNPMLLAAADMLGITEIYRTGSAWAVAALTFGTESIAPVDLIAGPGNIYVTTAKRLLIGKVGIDMIAGPSEIAILAEAFLEKDGTQAPSPQWLAADMLSQAEHDSLASAILVTTSETLAKEVVAELEKQVVLLPRKEIAQESLRNFGAVVLVPDLDTGIELINRIAPEHLELVLANPWESLGKVRHAGAIFLGQYAAEPVGDYFAGPNHVLPTMGTARFSSGLSVDNFCKKSSLLATSASFAKAHGEKIARLARLECLEAHARSMECRLGKK